MNKKYTYFIIILLIIASCAAFGRIAGNDFINLDDNLYITQNNHIISGINSESIKWAFINRDSAMWLPMTWISLMLDWSIFGANASGYYIVNLLLHLGTMILLFLFLFRTTNNLWPTAFAVAFFAMHPLRVESVAWAAERKDVLSMFFGMTSLYVYSFYAENPKPWRYFSCLILFALALMSKSMLISLPFVMLLLDYWPMGRYQSLSTHHGSNLKTKLLLEKVPFFILSIASGIVTIWAQYNQHVLNPQTFPLRVANAFVSYVAYLRMTFLPVDLSFCYTFVYSFPLWQILGSAIILIAFTVFTVYHIKKMPFLFTGWFWYMGTLAPVSGLVPTNVPMADHYTYLPSIGIAIILGWGIPALIKSEFIRKKILFPAAIAFLFIMAVLTWSQCGYWKNSITIFNHALKVTKDNYFAHNNLGAALYEEGNFNEAIVQYNQAILIKTDYGDAYSNRGSAYAKLGHYQQAMDDFSKAIHLKPDFAIAYKNRGIIYIIQGNNYLGCRDVQKACALGNCKLLEEGYCR